MTIKKPDQQMLDALERKDLEAVKQMVTSGFDLKTVPGYGSYLSYAWGHYGDYDFEIVKYLIEKGGVNLNDSSDPAIIIAAGRGKLDELQYILDRGADINALSRVNTSALWKAAYRNQIEEINYLLEHGLDINIHGGRALQVAASRGYLDAVKLLIEAGADINHQDFKTHPDDSATPLHNAAFHGHVDVVKYLLACGADPLLKDHYGERPYTAASSRKLQEIMELLVAVEPQELHDFERKAAELKRMGLPVAIINDLGNTRTRIELRDSNKINYIELCSVLDVTELRYKRVKMFNLLFEVDSYSSLGLLVWVPSWKKLGTYDIEHAYFSPIPDVTWKDFLNSPSKLMDRILDWEFHNQEQE